MIDPVVYQYTEWTPHKRGMIDCNATGSYKLRYGTIAVNGDRDVPDWCRRVSPSESELYKPKQPRLI